MFVKPGMHKDADGKDRQLSVRLPHTRQLMPAEGMDVDENDLYWARMLRDKDVVPAKPAKPAKGSPESAA